MTLPQLLSLIALTGFAAAAQAQTDLAATEGVVRPARLVELRAPLIGQVKEILVEEAQPAEKGDVLVRLDDAMQQAVLDGAVAAAKQARLVLDSTTQMRESHAASPFELKRAELDHEQAQANLRLEQERLAQYQLRAPFDGRVIRVQKREGSTVGQEDVVLVFAELSTLVAELHLPAERYDSIREGQGYELTAGVPVHRTLRGVCKTREPIIDSASRTFRCVFTIENREDPLPAGFSVTLQPSGLVAHSE